MHSWRNTDRTTTAYLITLADHGYTLSDVEHLACGQLQPGDGDGGDEGVDG